MVTSCCGLEGELNVEWFLVFWVCVFYRSIVSKGVWSGLLLIYFMCEPMFDPFSPIRCLFDLLVLSPCFVKCPFDLSLPFVIKGWPLSFLNTEIRVELGQALMEFGPSWNSPSNLYLSCIWLGKTWGFLLQCSPILRSFLLPTHMHPACCH